MGKTCATCGHSIFDPGRQPYRTSRDGDITCKQCKLAELDDTWTCVECGLLESDNWVAGVGDKLRARSLCHSCDLWVDRVDEIDSGKRAQPVINGTFYGYDPERPIRRGDPSHLGHAGRTFHILWNDGREVTTNNLWCGGDVPEHFRDRLPDTATFVTAKAVTS